MGKINYELASWLCIYDSNTRTIKELEKHYKAHPYNYIKEEIIACLNDQKDLLKKINSCGFSKHYFDTFKVNKKCAKETRELKKIITQASKVVNSKKVSKATYKIAATLLISSLLIGITSSSTGKCIGEAELTPKLIDELVEKNILTKETVEVSMTSRVGSQPQIDVYTLELKNKHYDIKCPEELQDYFYELEEKWDIPAKLAMLIVDQESDGQWNTNGVVSVTNDYGLPQINECNLAEIKEVLGYSKDDILYNPYKSLDAMFYLLTKIFDLYNYTKDNYDTENVCGTYNGYIYWRNKEQSLTYVSECMERYNTIFTDDRDKEKLLVHNM